MLIKKEEREKNEWFLKCFTTWVLFIKMTGLRDYLSWWLRLLFLNFPFFLSCSSFFSSFLLTEAIKIERCWATGSCLAQKEVPFINRTRALLLSFNGNRRKFERKKYRILNFGNEGWWWMSAFVALTGSLFNHSYFKDHSRKIRKGFFNVSVSCARAGFTLLL